MIIDCKECGTKFKINEAIYGQKGASVHCGVCRRTFFLSPEAINGEDLKQSQSTIKLEKFSPGANEDDSHLMLLKEKRELDSILSRIAKGEEISLPESQDEADNYPIADNADNVVEEDDKKIALLREKRELDGILDAMEGKSGASRDATVKATVKAMETPQFKKPAVVEEIKKKPEAYPDATVKTTVKAIEAAQIKQPPVAEIQKRSGEPPVSATITKSIKEKEVATPDVQKIKAERPAAAQEIKPQEKKVDKPTAAEAKPVEDPEEELPPWRRIRWAMTILFTIFLCIATQSVFIMLNPDMGYNATKWISENVPFMAEYLEVKVPPVIDSVADRIKVTNIRQRIVSNASLGIMRVVEGDAVNGAPYPVSFIKVAGHLLNARKAVLATSYTYCGNIISDEELAIIEEGDIQKALYVTEGQNSSNTSIQPGGLVPFMIIFIREPENVDVATVKPVWAKRQ